MRVFTRLYCIPFRNARAKSEGDQFRRVQKAPKLIGYHSKQRPLRYRATRVSCIIPIHTSTNGKIW